MQTKKGISLIIIILTIISCSLSPAQTKNSMNKEWPPLPKALDEGRFDDAKKYLGNKNNHYFWEKPLIVYFADNGSYSREIIQFLIENGINKQHYGEALIQVVSYSDLESVERLLAAGADINTKSNESNSIFFEGFKIPMPGGKNSLYYAKDQAVAKYLIDKGIEIEEDSIFTVAYHNFPLLRALDDAGYKGPDIPEKEANKYLLTAARLGDAQAVKFFLDKGADVNTISLGNPDPSQKVYGNLYRATPLITNTNQGYSEPNFVVDAQVSPDVAKILIEAGADINIKDEDGRTALHYTCIAQISKLFPQTKTYWSRQHSNTGHGHPIPPVPYQYDLIGEALINAGADINIMDNDRNTPLILAVMNKRHTMVKNLLAAGARTDIKNKAGDVAFNFASDYKTINIICKAGYDGLRLKQEDLNTMLKGVFNKDFFRYNMEIDKEAFSNLIAMGADISTLQPNLIYLIENAIYQKPEDIELPYLLKLGINVNTEGKTPLMYAAERRNYSKEYTSLLLKYGADVNTRNNNSATALTIARSEKNMDAATLLEKAGAVRDLDSEWWYALNKGWANDDLDTLLSEGANINAQTIHPFIWDNAQISGDGITALMYLAKRWRVESVKFFIKKGAKANIKDSNGMTVLHHAAGGPDAWRNISGVGSISDKDVKEIIPLLIKAGADPNMKDNAGNTAKDYADKNRMLGISEVLAKYTNP